jgi:hypothetical protein
MPGKGLFSNPSTTKQQKIMKSKSEMLRKKKSKQRLLLIDRIFTLSKAMEIMKALAIGSSVRFEFSIT